MSARGELDHCEHRHLQNIKSILAQKACATAALIAVSEGLSHQAMPSDVSKAWNASCEQADLACKATSLCRKKGAHIQQSDWLRCHLRQEAGHACQTYRVAPGHKLVRNCAHPCHGLGQSWTWPSQLAGVVSQLLMSTWLIPQVTLERGCASFSLLIRQRKLHNMRYQQSARVFESVVLLSYQVRCQRTASVL